MEPSGHVVRLTVVTMDALRPVPSRDPAAFEAFYAAAYRPMVFLAFTTTQSVEAAEEIAQEAFVQLYRNWDRVTDHRAWLRRAVISLSTSWVRRTVKSREVDTVPPLVSQGESEVSAEVWSALSALPPRQRAAIVLRYVEDLSERDIAAVLQCRPGTVKSMLSRARDVLRRELSDDQD
jgi:RNA polymerase sigma-70 factor (sigma-E family)